jgi:hypothetical protein
MNAHTNIWSVHPIHFFLETRIYDNRREYKRAYIIYRKDIKLELIREMQNGTKSHVHVLIKFLSMGGTKECKLFARTLKRNLTIKTF